MARRGIRKKFKPKDSNFQKKGVRQNYPLAELEKSNQVFFDYYKRQGIIPDGDFDAFVSALRQELPTSFRIQGCYKDPETLVTYMNEHYFKQIMECGDPEVHTPEPIPWLPGAFQTCMSRSAVRSHPILKAFHNFLVSEAELGNISRQEAVSMIPPLLLDVESHHRILDVCAAPGSKTVQIIEMMHRETERPEGIVVANDADNRRCYLLVRQALKRMPSSNCVVINEDAAFLPTLMVNKESEKALLFDRVLCDVVCSGDGTFRKNPDLWREWNPDKAIGLHKLQLRIAIRSAQLLEVGGLMVYSTCSMNPIEDEAIVAGLLRYGNGAIELVDVSARLPELKRSQGVSSWKVIDKDLKEYGSVDDIVGRAQKFLVPSMFPPAEEEAKRFHLERCFRIFPHLQNTGGFFVAVLRKTQPFDANVKTILRVRAPPSKRLKSYKEDPFVFLEEGDVRWKDIAQYYGILDTFPYQNLLGRTTEVEKKRTLYYVNDAVKNFLLCNQEKVKVINAGIRMFGRVETKFEQCRFRMSQDGVHTIFPFLTKRVLETEAVDLYNVLKSNEAKGGCSKEELLCAEKLDKFTSGSVILFVSINGVRRMVCCWLGAKGVYPYVSKEERIHAIRALGYDTSELEDRICSKRQEKALRAAEEGASKSEEHEDEDRVSDADDAGDMPEGSSTAAPPTASIDEEDHSKGDPKCSVPDSTTD